MTKQQFIKKAIEKGYDGKSCNGWEWIKENLDELNSIFETEEYKTKNGMKYKCMPLIIGKDIFTKEEEDVLSTAWFLNNERVYKKEKAEKIAKFNTDGFFTIESDEKLHGKKIEFIMDNSDELFGGIVKYTGKLYWSVVDKRLMAMKTKCRRRGCWVDTNNIFIKVL